MRGNNVLQSYGPVIQHFNSDENPIRKIIPFIKIIASDFDIRSMSYLINYYCFILK